MLSNRRKTQIYKIARPRTTSTSIPLRSLPVTPPTHSFTVLIACATFHIYVPASLRMISCLCTILCVFFGATCVLLLLIYLWICTHGAPDYEKFNEKQSVLHTYIHTHMRTHTHARTHTHTQNTHESALRGAEVQRYVTFDPAIGSVTVRGGWGGQEIRDFSVT